MLDALRFYVKDEQDRPRSSLWRAFHHGDDVYIAPRNIAGSLKLSVHRDGNCQYGTTSVYVRKAREQGSTEFPSLVRWRRPATPESGATHVMSILFPTDFLRSADIPPPSKFKLALQLAPSGRAVEVMLFYSKDDPAVPEAALRRRGIIAFGYMTLPCGEVAVLAARHVAFDPKFVPDLESLSGKMRPLLGSPRPGERFDDAHAILLHKKPSDGGVLHLAEINGLSVHREVLTDGSSSSAAANTTASGRAEK